MIQQLAEILAQHIRAANLVTVAGGLATVWKSNSKEKNSKAAYWDYAASEHKLLVPDADKAAIVYFEEKGSTKINGSKAGAKYTADLALFGWVNTDLNINTPTLIEQLQELFSGTLQLGNFQHIKVQFTELLPENEQLFSRYNYDAGVRKYLQKPYDAFGLRFSVSFNVIVC